MKKFLYNLFVKNWYLKLLALALAVLTIIFINI